MSNDNELENANVEQQEQKEINVDELVAQMNAMQEKMSLLASTNERLLNESKANKNKYQSLRTEVEQKQKADLEASENFKELLDMEKNRAFELEEQNKKIKQSVIRERLNFEVARHAKNAYDINDVIHSLPKDMLNIDEENLKVEGIKEAVEIVMKNKPHLFNNGIKSHGMGQEPPEGYKPENKEPTFEELLLGGMKSGAF